MDWCMGMKKMSKYPDGICPECGKRYARPNKYRTEEEGYHVKGCMLKRIQKESKEKPDMFKKLKLIGELEYISKTSSFDAKKGNKYYDRMLECERLVKMLGKN